MLAAGRRDHGHERARGAADGAPARDAPERLRQRAVLPQEARGGGHRSRRRGLPRRRRRPAVHDQGRPARPLPLRHVRAAARTDRARARQLRHDGQPHDRRLHARRHRDVGSPHRPHSGRRRRSARRPAAERLRLRALHRRPRPALRRRAPGLYGGAHLGGQHRASAQDHARFRRHRPQLHAVLRHVPGRRRPRPGAAPRRPARPRGLPRRRAVDQRASPPDRGRPGSRRARHLRALGDGRPGGRLRVSVQSRHARQRGPLPRGDRGSREPAAAAVRRSRRARVHHAHARGAAARPLPHPRPLQPDLRIPAPAGGRRRG